MHKQTLLLVACCGALALAAAACGGGDGPSVRADTATTSSSSSTTSSTAPSTTTTSTTTPPAPPVTPPGTGQIVRYAGLAFRAPTSWPVHDLVNEPKTCARLDQHAVYLGEEGANAVCPAEIKGITETVQVEPIDARSQLAAARATWPTTINGLPARIDPKPDLNGALTVVLPNQNVVVILTYVHDRPTVDAIQASFVAS
jgi:hypothetical protein